MKTSPYRLNPSRQALTAIELLVLLVFIGVLAALVLPVVDHPKPASRARARMEIALILQAIKNYRSTYGGYPISGGLGRRKGRYK